MRSLKCSFCRRREQAVDKLVAGPRVYICDRCVAIAQELMNAPVDPGSAAAAGEAGVVRRLVDRCRRLFGSRQHAAAPRDLGVALAGAAITLACAALVGAQQPSVLSSRIFDWDSLKVEKTNVGARRDVVRAPTATLDELEMHITTLNAGQQSHPPHQHVAEELLIIKEGTLESLVNGQYRKVGPGSIVFQASNQLHTIRNIGTGPATYHVIQWQPPGMLNKR